MARFFAGGKELADREDLDKLSGKSHIRVDDANKMTESGFHYISNHDSRHDYPVQSWGNMIVSNGENQRIVQIFTPDDGKSPWFRTFDGSAWHDWHQFATMNNINKLEQEFSDLKKKIGGVTSHLYDYLRKALATSTKNMEVA